LADPRRILALALALLLALQLTGIAALAGTQAHAADPQEIVGLPTAPAPYAWSRTAVETTGDFFADTYNGVGAGSVFEDVTVDRLADILSAAGDYYVVFANPNTASGQVILADINAQAKAAGITRIYHFNPVVDNFRLDITSTDPAIRDITSGSWSTGITGGAEGTSFATIPHSIGGIYTYIKSLLPVYYADNNTAEDQATRAVFDGYTSQQTLLFRFHKDNHTDLPAAASIDATYLFGEADGTVSYSETAEAAKIAPVFQGSSGSVPADTRSEYQFITRGFAATGASPAISAADYPDGAGFNLDSVTFEEVFNLLNSSGEHSFYFFAFGCGDTKALIAKAALAAKANGTTLYLVDGSLGGSIRYKGGSDIDVLSSSTSNAWLNIRLGNSTDPTSAQKQLSYLYGELVNGYFGDGFITQNSFAKASNNIQYYVNGDIGNPDALTNGFKQDGATRPYAPRLQYPILLTYNKAYVEPVTLDTTAIKVTKNQDGVVTGVTEYMGSVAKQDSSYNTDAFTPYVNVTNPQYLAAQRATQQLATEEFTTLGTPTITSDDPNGLPVIGVALHANTGTWVPTPSSFSYQWFSFDDPISDATGASYIPVIEDYCNEISVKVTAHLSGYEDATVQSDFVQPEPAEYSDATVYFEGASEAVVGAEVEYELGLGNIAGPAAFEATVTASDELQLKSVVALDDEWIAAVIATDSDNTKKIVFGPRVSDPEASLYAAAPQLKLVYTATAAGSATVTLQSVRAAAITGFVDNIAQVVWAPVDAPQGDKAVITTTVEEAQSSSERFDFNQDDEVDLLDLAFAKAYYGASAEVGGDLWDVALEHGIDVDESGEIDVADLIIIINNIYGLQENGA
jgi:hypothetical protein